MNIVGQKTYIGGGTIVDPKYPIVRNDERLNKGSLLLIDFASSGYKGAGVPASGDLIYNVAHEEAAALCGAGDETSLSAAWTNNLGPTEAIFERTALGALHGIVSQTNQVANHAATVSAPSLVLQYLVDHPDHLYGYVFWQHVTRLVKAANANSIDVSVDSTSTAPSNYLFHFQARQAVLGPNRLAKTGVWTGTPPPALANSRCQAGWGSTGSYVSIANNSNASYVFYGAHLCDLTAAEMSAADFVNADAALYAKWFAAGGLRYGDVIPTDPASLP